MTITTIETALPLPAQVMVQFFKDKKNIGFEIDYDQSLANLRSPKSVLQYLANINAVQNSNLKVDKIPVDLLSSYIVMRDKCRIEQLTKAHANVLYFLKYQIILYPELLDSFGFDEMAEFVEANANELMIQAALLNSLPLFMITSIDATGDTERSENAAVTTIDETIHAAISVSLFNLFALEDFLILYLEQPIPLERQIYFKPHYDKPMYGGKTMFGWFAVPGNTYFAMHDYVAEKIDTGPGRYELIETLAALIKGTGDATLWKEFREVVDAAPSVKELMGLTNRDLAEINRRIKKKKKQHKKAQ